MPFSVTMPALGESVSEGTVTRWLKQEGDRVEADEPLLEVSTDKVDTEVPSPAAGVLQRIVVQADETVDVGAELALIAAEDEAAGSDSAQPAAPKPAGAVAPTQQTAASPVESAPQADTASAAYPAAPAGVPSPAEQPATSSASAEEGTSGGSTGGAGTVTGFEVTMPALGESVTEGTITTWLKSVGDEVAADEPLLEVSTDKVDTEVPSPSAGTLLEIRVQADETVSVGTVLAVIGDASAQAAQPSAPAPQAAAPAPAAPAPAAQAPQAPAPQAPAAPAPAPAQAPAAQAPAQAPAPQAPAAATALSGGSDAYVTPLVRKLAAEHGVDLSTLTGTGVGGRIRKQDVLDAAAATKAQPAASPAATQQAGPAAPAAAAAVKGAPEPSPLRGTRVKMSRLRKVIANRMVESLQTSAQLTSVVEVDVTKVAQLRARAKREFEAREGVKLSFLPFFAKATVDALKAYPVVNASIDGDDIVYAGAEHLGIAVDTERGLLVPVIKDAGDLNIAGLSRKIADLAQRTRDNKVTPDELGGGTFTLTNTGSRGALFDTPILNQPQVGILGTGAVVKRPVVVNSPEFGETIAIRSMVYLALSYDHRIVDGADAARFLTAIKQRLEEASFEADLGL